MPFWTRNKTGEHSLQMLGNEISGKIEDKGDDGLFVDRLFYKSSNQVALGKLNQTVFAKSGSLQDNFDRMRADPEILTPRAKEARLAREAREALEAPEAREAPVARECDADDEVCGLARG